MKFLDSSLIVDVLRGNEDAASYLESNTAPLVTSTIVAKEIFVGEYLADEDIEQEAVRASLGWLRLLEYTTEHALAAAEIHARLHRSGSVINRADILIAGTPVTLDIPIVARDRDFDRIEGLDVETY